MAESKRFLPRSVRAKASAFTAAAVVVGTAVVLPSAAQAYGHPNVIEGKTVVAPLNYQYGATNVGEYKDLVGAAGTNKLGHTFEIERTSTTPTRSHITDAMIADGSALNGQQAGGWYMFYALKDDDKATTCESSTIKANALNGQGTLCSTVTQQITFDVDAVNPGIAIRSAVGVFSNDPYTTDDIPGETTTKSWPRNIRIVSIDGQPADASNFEWILNDPAQPNALYTEQSADKRQISWTEDTFKLGDNGAGGFQNGDSKNQPYITFNGSPRTAVIEFDMYALPVWDVANPKQYGGKAMPFTENGNTYDWIYGYANTPAGFWTSEPEPELTIEKSLKVLDADGNIDSNVNTANVVPGAKVAWDLTVTNLSADNENYGFVVKDSLPAGFTIDKVTNADGTDADNCTITGQDVQCKVAPVGYEVDDDGKLVEPNATAAPVPAALAGGASKTFYVYGTITKPLSGKDVENTAEVVSPYDPNKDNNGSTAKTHVLGSVDSETTGWKGESQTSQDKGDNDKTGVTDKGLTPEEMFPGLSKVDPTPDYALVNDNGDKVTEITKPGVGKYVIDPKTGIVTFTPEPGFVGDAPSVTVIATITGTGTAADGESLTAKYTPHVLAKPAPGKPDPAKPAAAKPAAAKPAPKKLANTGASTEGLAGIAALAMLAGAAALVAHRKRA